MPKPKVAPKSLTALTKEGEGLKGTLPAPEVQERLYNRMNSLKGEQLVGALALLDELTAPGKSGMTSGYGPCCRYLKVLKSKGMWPDEPEFKRTRASKPVVAPE